MPKMHPFKMISKCVSLEVFGCRGARINSKFVNVLNDEKYGV